MTCQSRSRASASAFTLIEILVVVAIIALLISILLPSLAAARDQARNAKCLANMRDMATGSNTFSMAHKNRFQLVTGGAALSNNNDYDAAGPKADLARSTYVYESGQLPAGAQGPALLSWPVVLLREAGNRSMRRNSDWAVAAATRDEAKGRVREYEQMLCPGDTFRTGTPVYPNPPSSAGSNVKWYGALSYAINEDIVGDDRTNAGKPTCWKEGQSDAGSRLQGVTDKIIRPGEVLLLVDGGLDRIESGASVKEPWHLILSRSAAAPYLEFCTYSWNNRVPLKRHAAGAVNIAYADGHGGSVKKIPGKYTKVSGVNDYAYMPRVRVSPYNVGKLPF